MNVRVQHYHADNRWTPPLLVGCTPSSFSRRYTYPKRPHTVVIEEQEDSLFADLWYFNGRSIACESGELRGQIVGV
jgi:hypothetical protein